MQSFIKSYTLSNKIKYASAQDYTKDDIITLMRGTDEIKVFAYDYDQINFLKNFPKQVNDYIKCSDNFISFCTLYCIYSYWVSLSNFNKKVFQPQQQISFLIGNTIYTMMSQNFSTLIKEDNYFCIVSEEERSLTNNLKYNFIQFFDCDKIKRFGKGSNLVIKDKIGFKQYRFLKLPYFYINDIKTLLEYPVITCEGDSLRTLEVSYFITVYYKNMFEEMEKFIDTNLEFPTLNNLFVDFIFKINKHTLEDLETMVLI